MRSNPFLSPWILFVFIPIVALVMTLMQTLPNGNAEETAWMSRLDPSPFWDDEVIPQWKSRLEASDGGIWDRTVTTDTSGHLPPNKHVEVKNGQTNKEAEFTVGADGKLTIPAGAVEMGPEGNVPAEDIVLEPMDEEHPNGHRFYRNATATHVMEFWFYPDPEGGGGTWAGHEYNPANPSERRVAYCKYNSYSSHSNH